MIEQGGADGAWYRGYLVAPPSLLAGLTSVKGQTLEARVFSGIFPKNCVEVREVLGETDGKNDKTNAGVGVGNLPLTNGDSRSSSTAVDGPGTPDTKASRKLSQMTMVKLEDEAGNRRSGVSGVSASSIALRPYSAGAPDRNGAKPPAPVPMLKIGDETPTSASEPLVDEIASCLREWHSTNIHELLLARQYNTLENMSNIVLELDLARRQLLHNVLTAQERAALREETVWNLVRGNKMVSGEVIVRDPKDRGRLLTGDDSAVHLTKLQSEMSMLDGGITQTSESVSLHHLLFELNAVTGTNTGPVGISVYLCLQTATGDVKPLSETYSVDVPSADSFSALAKEGKLKTLFAELSATDIGEGSGADSRIYLVVKVLGWETPTPNRGPKARSSSRDGSISRPSLNSAGKGSLRGRRSMVWSQKQRGLQHPEPIKEDEKPTSRSSNSSGGKETKPNAQPPKDTTVSRTVGIGALEIGPVLRSGKEVEHSINIWSPLGDSDEDDGHSDGFSDIIPSLLYSPTGRYARCYRAARLHAHIHAFACSDSKTLVKNNPTLLHSITQTRRIGFPGAPTRSRSDIYVSLSRVNISRDALLSHPAHGQVPAPQASGLLNLQLTLEVRSSSGARIENCIYPSSNSAGITAWRTTVAERRSAWNQTIRINIPSDQVHGSHLIMSVADAPDFPFALSWMPLWDQQAFIRDGPHSLLLHAYDKSTSSLENGKGAYLALPWSALGKNESTKDEAVTGPVATLSLETDLCSTEYSQDQIMLGLINWREKSATQLLELLRRIVFVPEIEIVKQLSDVFDALFGIIVEHAGNEEFEDLIFSDLVTVLGIVHDRRFKLGPLVDKYAEERFNFPFATPCLIRSYSRLLQATPDSQQSRNLRAAFKVGRHILKFIINARGQQKAKEENIGITNIQSTFNRDLHFIFKSVESLMQNPAPILVGSKTLVVQHFHTWLPELSNALTKEEIIDIALRFMEACRDVKSMLILYKLVLILNYVRLPLFQEETERKLLLSHSINWIAPYWGEADEATDQYRDQVRLCSSIVAEQLKFSDPELFGYLPQAAASYCAIQRDGVDESDWLSLLFSKSFPFQLKQSKTSQKFDEALVELSAIIAAISTIPNPVELSLDHDDLAIFLSNALNAHISVLSCEAYPATWLSLHIYHHRSVMNSLEYISSALIKSFLPSPEDADNFDMELWRLFITTLLKLVSSESLALETFPEQKRRAVWKIAGDVREHGAELLRTTWKAIGWDTDAEEREQYGLEKLGGYQVQYVPSLVPPIIELCLSVHEGPRRVAVEILQSMIVSEWQLNDDLAVVEAEIISSLDALFKSKNLTESITRKLFINELLDLFESDSGSGDAELMVALKELVATVDELLDLLVAAHSGNITESLNTLKLMEFMKDMDKEDLFIRYVHELADGQAAARNFTEAALALQFHADLYDWDVSRVVPALMNPVFPEQTAFERKEALYFEIIQHLEDGKAWAHALSCYRELSGQYEQTTIDFSKLSRTQASMARIYDAIVKEDISVPRYFRVIYKGLGFPTTLRDKQYIFEGTSSDRLTSFTDRMQKQYPSAQVITSSEIEDLEGQFLQISTVSIQRDINHPVYQRSKVPQSVRDHLLTSVPSTFSITSKKHTNGNDVMDHWVSKTVYTASEPFPNILRRSEIVATEEVSLTPLQTAIERTCRKTQELIALEKKSAAGGEASLSILRDALGQLLDVESRAPTSIALYRRFLGDDDLPEEDEEEEQVVKPVDPLKNALTSALIDHALAIKRCLALFAHQPQQLDLTRRFENIFAPELSTLAPSISQQMQPDFSSPFRSPDFLSNGNGNGNTPQLPSISQVRSISPELERERLTRQESNPKPETSPTVTRRMSLNPFKRSNHNPSGSTATITRSNSKVSSPISPSHPNEVKINGTAFDPLFKSPTSSTHKSDKSQSDKSAKRQGSRTETTQKRRSFFSSSGGSSTSVVAGTAENNNNSHSPNPNPNSATAIPSRQNSASVPPTSPPMLSHVGSTEDMRTTQQRILERAKAARALQENQNQNQNQNQGQGQQVPERKPVPKPGTANSQARPSTTGSSRAGTSAGAGAGTANSSNNDLPNTNNNAGSSASGVRESVMKRFSMLKSGRKPSRANLRDGKGGFGGVLKEE